MLDQAIQIRPTHGNLYVVRADAYHQQREHQKAIEDYDRAIRWEPTSINYQARGCYRLMTNQMEAAMQDLLTATDCASPRRVATADDWSLVALGHTDQALKIVDRYQQYLPDDIDIHIQKMQTLASNKRLDEAMQASNDALTRCTNDFDRYRIYGNRIGIHDQVGDYVAALKDLEKMLTIYPDDQYAMNAKDRFLAKALEKQASDC